MSTKVLTAAQIFAARKNAKAKQTAKAARQVAAANTEGLTYAQLTDAHKTEAIRYAVAVNKPYLTPSQIRRDALSEAVADALVYVYQNQDAWDSAKGSFRVFFGLVVRRYATNALKAKDNKNESYSYAGEDDSAEFSYSGSEYADSQLTENESGRKAEALLAKLRAKLPARQAQVLELMLQGVENQVIAEAIGASVAATNKLVFDLRANVTKLTGLTGEAKKIKEFSFKSYEVASPELLAELA